MRRIVWRVVKVILWTLAAAVALFLVWSLIPLRETIAPLTGGSYIFIEDARHEIWWERPEEFERILLEFISGF